MGDGVYRRGKVWAYRFNAGPNPVTGRRRQPSESGFRTKKEAVAARAKAMARHAQGKYVEHSRLTVQEFLATWIEDQKERLQPSTLHSYRVALRRLNEYLGSHTLQSMTAVQVEACYRDMLDSGLSAKTVRNTHTVLRKAVGDAERLGLVARNVVASAQPPRARRPQIATWSVDELSSALEHMRGSRLFMPVLLLATTGMRRGEVLGLRWSDINLDGSTLMIQQSRTAVNGAPVVSDPKTAGSRRSVWLDDLTVAELRAHYEAQQEERRAAGDAWEDDEDWVFRDEIGRPLHPDRFSRAFSLAVDDLAADDIVRKIRLHDLRHSYATHALAAGVHPKVVSDRLGHSGISITLDLYSHVTPALGREAADAVAGQLFREPKD